MVIWVCIMCICYIAFIIAMMIGFSDDTSTDDSIKIKFNSFVSFYNINPDRWKLNDSNVYFVIKVQNSYTYLTNEKYTKFKFNIIDTIKYKHWKYQKKKNDKTLKECEEYQKVLEIIQQDIRTVQNESMRLSNEGLDILRNVVNK